MNQKTITPGIETPPARIRPKWYRRPWIVPLAAICVFFVLMRLPDYLGLDPQDSFLDLQKSFPNTHYQVLAAHVLFGSIALLTCCMQVWPWLRANHPAVHRISGRVYVLAGVLPGGVLALVVSVIAIQEVPGIVGNSMLALLWLATTFVGFRMVRQRRFVEHRRWMIRSFALCTSIVVNRAWIWICVAILLPFQDSLYGGSFDALLKDAIVVSIWLSWVVNLLIAEWWLDRKPRRPAVRN
ncbi:MAG: DUF2306 domain-containing protein [Stackebrandtia sp.]